MPSLASSSSSAAASTLKAAITRAFSTSTTPARATPVPAMHAIPPLCQNVGAMREATTSSSPPTAAPPPAAPHYHILGAGAMGCLFGAALAHKAGVRVSLLTRHPPSFPTATIHVQESYGLRAPSPPSLPPPPLRAFTSAFEADSSSYTAHVFLEENTSTTNSNSSSSSGSTNTKISHLFVLTKAYDIEKALKNIAPRLGNETIVLVLSNGMGCVEAAQAALREVRGEYNPLSLPPSLPPSKEKSSSSSIRSSSSSSSSSSEGGRKGGEEGPVWVVGTITHGALKMEGGWKEGREGGKEGEVPMTSSSSSSSSDKSVHFYAEHTGLGQTFLGLPLLPPSLPPSFPPSSEASPPPSLPLSLLSHLTLAGLFPVYEEPREMRKRLWLKLGVNVVINPLTALLNCRNGEILEDMPSLPPSLPPSLLSSSSLRGLVRELCGETAAVAIAVEREEQNTITSPSSPFSSTPSSLPPSLPPSSMPTADELELFTVQVANATAGNQSSMLRDLIREGGREGGKEGGREGGGEGKRRGRRTEIEYLNGFIVREGRRLGVSVPRHEVLTELVRAREREGGREGVA